MPDFKSIWEWERRENAVVIVFTPSDVEAMYEASRNKDDPPFKEAWEQLQHSWTWRKGLNELLSERGNDILGDMIGDFLTEK